MKNLGMFRVRCVASGRVTTAQLWLHDTPYGTMRYEWYHEGNVYDYSAFIRENEDVHV